MEKEPKKMKTEKLCNDEIKKIVNEEDIINEFNKVKKNKTACLTFLVRLFQRIELHWNDCNQRIKILSILVRVLNELKEHKEEELRELSRLAEKVKEISVEKSEKLGLKHYLGLFLPIERKYTRGLSDHQFIITRDDTPKDEHILDKSEHSIKLPVTVVLDNLRSAFNVGAIFRTSECVSIKEILLCGYTATPKDKKTQHTTMNAHKYIDWKWYQHTSDVLKLHKNSKDKRKIIALETVEGSSLIYEYEFPKEGCILILGNERHGIEEDVLSLCDDIVSIPVHGVKNSLNVGVAYGICLYEITRQLHYNNYKIKE